LGDRQSLDMRERNQTLIGIQTDAIAAILSLPQQGKRAAAFGLTILNKTPRGVGAIRRRYEKRAGRMGWNARQIAEQWTDIKDMARLQAIAE
jgi:hypothetical protein